MKTYKCKNIRNIALTGHSSSGKTSLAESLLYVTGAIDRLGKIADGNTVCDYDSEEIKRTISINTSLCYAEWKDVKVNIIDTPGQFDFAGGVDEGIRAAESVVITVPGKSGIEVGTVKAYQAAVKNNKSRLFVVTKMDEENADFYKVLTNLKTQFGPSVCPIIVPFCIDEKVDCYINLIEMKAYKYDAKGKPTEVPMPNTEHRLEGLISAISEAVAETDEALMDKFFEGEAFTETELIKGMHDGIDSGTITPVVCCSGVNLSAVDMLLDTIVYMLPSPDELEAENAKDKSDSDVTVKYDETAPFCAYVFKTLADPFVGKLSYVKVISGKLSSSIEPINATTGDSERFGKIMAVRGKKSEDVSEAYAGDIVAITKLSANTSDTLCDSSRVIKLNPIQTLNPCFFMAVKAKGKGDESKISGSIHRLLEEDLTLSFAMNSETHEQILGGLGEQHLDVVVAKLKGKFGVEVELTEPIIAYRETIRKKVTVEGKHKKQSGGHGQYGHVKMEFEPNAASEEMVFEERVFGGSVPRNFFPAVEKGLQESVVRGVLAGYPVVRIKATLFDGSYHPVDSSEQAFKMAASIAFKEGMKTASPCLLEPIGTLKVVVTDSTTGDMMGELNKRRGRVLGMNPCGEGLTEIESEIPMSETHDFAMLVRQITQGMGSFTLEFARYEQLPQALEADVIASAPKRGESKDE